MSFGHFSTSAKTAKVSWCQRVQGPKCPYSVAADSCKNVQGVPIKNYPLAKIYCLSFCNIFFHQIYRFLPRDSCAKRGICRQCVSVCVCVCVCVSVTLRYCIKTTKRRITQITPHDSPGTLVFWHQSPRRNSNGITLRGRQMHVGWVKIRHFRRKTRYNSKTVQDRRIVSIKVE